ncbi:MAG: hypothetical protein ABI408_03290 [Gemmatimonadaceae bacterium]
MKAPLRIATAIAVSSSIAGCSTATTQRPADETIARTEATAVRSRAANPGSIVVQASPAAALAALNSAYADLGIEVKLFDPPHGLIGNRNFSKMYRLAGESLSNFMGCGLTQTGQGADSYRLTMSLVSEATPVANGSRIDTRLSGYGEDISTSKGTIGCQTTGALEAKLNDQALRHIGG